MNFSTRLKELRKSEGLTQCKMAERLFMEQSNYSKLETGAKSPNKEILDRLVNEFKVEKNSLLTDASALGLFPVLNITTSKPSEIKEILTGLKRTAETQMEIIDALMSVM